MVQLAWGMKRTCTSCNTRFYDFWKNPAACPECLTPFEIQISGRGKRSLKAVLKDLDVGHDDGVVLDDALADSLEKDDLEDGADLLGGFKTADV